MAGSMPCLAGFLLIETELNVAGNPTINTMVLAAGLPQGDYSPLGPNTIFASSIGKTDRQMRSVLAAQVFIDLLYMCVCVCLCLCVCADIDIDI